MNRREFTLEGALALLGCATIVLGGCESATDPSPVPVDLEGEIASNHGHYVTITAAAILAGSELEVDIRVASGHNHTVSLSTVDLAILRNGGQVQKESSGTRHTHLVTFRV